MNEPALVIIKPDGISKNLVGNILEKFAGAQMDIVGLRVIQATRRQAQEHYKHLRDKPFFEEIVDYLMGAYHPNNKLIAVVYYGSEAIEKCRQTAGATNPEQASKETVRGAYGRITPEGLFENVVHVSSDAAEAQREIKLWFRPGDIVINLYPVKTVGQQQEKVWV